MLSCSPDNKNLFTILNLMPNLPNAGIPYNCNVPGRGHVCQNRTLMKDESHLRTFYVALYGKRGKTVPFTQFDSRREP